MRTTQDLEFTAYVTAHRRDLLRTAMLLTAGDLALAEDLVQATLIKVYLGWTRITEPGPHGYARRALTTTFIDEHRRPWRRRERASAVLPDLAGSESHDHGLGEVGPALAALPPRMRAAVVLRHLHQLSVSETAAALGCSEGTVKSQTARGLDQLRRSLTEPASTNHPELTSRSTS